VSAAWFQARTVGAPEVLRERAAAFHAVAPGAGATQLATAGAGALEAAIAAGTTRAAALDLLAADGLITLALLAEAERDPAGLEAAARALRHAAAERA
jgi:hypothetical protein